MCFPMQYLPITRDKDDFQQPISLETINSICNSIFGSKNKIKSVQEFKSGLFNSSYFIELENIKWVLRAAPNKVSRIFQHEEFLMQREYNLYPYFAPVLKIIPKIHYSDFSHQIIDRDYVIQNFIKGLLWDEVKDNLTSQENESLWKQLGKIAFSIHKIKGKTFGLPHPMEMFTDWSDAVIYIVEMMYDDLIDLEIEASGIDEFIWLLKEGRTFLDEFKEPCLIHGDLWPKNVLINKDNKSDSEFKITGLLDSERAFWGDPLAEWIFYYVSVPQAFWKGYGTNLIAPSKNYGIEYRKNVYFGLYSIQIILETWRFKFDPTKFGLNLLECVKKLNSILKLVDSG